MTPHNFFGRGRIPGPVHGDEELRATSGVFANRPGPLVNCDLFGHRIEALNQTEGGIIFAEFTATRGGRSGTGGGRSEANPHSPNNRFPAVVLREQQARQRLLENLQRGWVHLFEAVARQLRQARLVSFSYASSIAATGHAEAQCFRILTRRSCFVLDIGPVAGPSAWFGRLREVAAHGRPTYFGFDSAGGFNLNPPDRYGRTDYALGGESYAFPYDPPPTDRVDPAFTINCIIERHRRDGLGQNAQAINEEREATIHELIVHCWRVVTGRFLGSEINHRSGTHLTGVNDDRADNMADRESDLLRAAFSPGGVSAHGQAYNGPWHWPWVRKLDQLPSLPQQSRAS